MRAWIKSFAAAMAMYTRLPVLPVKWDQSSLKYALCCFPAAGLIIGALFLLWTLAAQKLLIGRLFFAAVSAAIPLLISGGIHLDGFCDTTDAVFSYKSRAERLDIMRDPHVGAFGSMFTALYLLLWTGAMSELAGGYIAVGFLFALERSLSGLMAAATPGARREGTVRTFADGASEKTPLVLAAEAVILAGIMIYKEPLAGAAGVAGVVGAFILCRRYALKTFGGVTGDICGWFLQIAELAAIILMVMVQKGAVIYQL